MRYSLVSRFRGTLVGGLLGEHLASGRKKSDNYPNLAQSIIPSAKSLITLGKLDLDDWLRYQKEFITPQASVITINKIFATIPITLFFHENPVKLRQNLLRVLKIWDDDPVIRDSILAIGYAIAQSLTEKLHRQTLIPQIISFIGETETLLPQKLLVVHKILEQHAGLETLKAQLSREEKLSYAVAMALYCFLSTYEDFRLSVLRSLQVDVHSQTITAITGALSGSYNSRVGIPAYWYSLLSANKETNWQVIELADSLAAVWSGVYNLALHPKEFLAPECIVFNESLPFSVYAAPRIIRDGLGKF